MRSRTLFVFLISLFVAGRVANAQTGNTGAIVGAVTDPSGAAVPDAKLVATDSQRGYLYNSTTTSDGAYRMDGLLPGTYDVKVEAPGFRAYINDGIILYTRQERRLDISLTVGSTAESITVQAQGSVINTETAPTATNMSSKEIGDYPPRMRGYNSATPMYVMLTAPGVHRSNATTNGGTGNDWKGEMDGNNADNRSNYRPSELSTQEVRVFALNAPAEFQSSSTAQAVSRSGNNEFHGTAQVLISNGALNALGPCGTCKRGPGIPSHTTDFALGGAAVRNRTFFYFSRMGWPDRTLIYTNGFVFPQAAMRSGDLSAIQTAVKDPLTGEAFPNNRIPGDRINPVATRVLDRFYPLPNRGSGTDLTDNYGIPIERKANRTNLNFRLDHQFTSKNRVFGFFSTIENDQTGMNYGSPASEAAIPEVAAIVASYPAKLFTIQDTHIFSPTVVNEFMFGINYTRSRSVTGTLPGDEILRDIGITDLGGRQLVSGVGAPSISIVGFSGIGSRAGSSDSENHRQYTVRNSISTQLGRHLIKGGVQYRFNNPSTLEQPAGSWGNMVFNGALSGYSFADFLLGLPNSTSILTPRTERVDRWSELGLYIQDDWRISPKLSLSLGLRNQTYTGPIDGNGLFYNFDLATKRVVVPDSALSAVNPAYPLPVVTAQTAGYPEDLIGSQPIQLEPRIGLAWQFAPKTVFRGGYGIYHALPPPRNNPLGARSAGPFQLTEEFGPNGIVDGAARFTLDRPFPGTPGRVSLQSVTAHPIDFDRPYLQQWNITLERELPWQSSIAIAYVGTRGTSIPYLYDANKPLPSTGTYTPNDPRFNQIAVYEYGGNTMYNALQVTMARQFNAGLYLRASFEQASFKGDVSSTASGLWAGRLIENPYDRRAFRGSYDMFEPRTFKLTAVYELPFGRGHRLLNGNSVMRTVLGNWTVSTYLFASAGALHTPTYSGADPSRTGTFSGTASLVPGCDPGGQTGPLSYFRRECFQVPELGAFGNAGIGSLRGPAWWSQFVSVFKDWHLGEWWSGVQPRLRIEGQASSPWNHPTQRTVLTNISASNFGYAAMGSTDGLTNGFRILQFNVALSF